MPSKPILLLAEDEHTHRRLFERNLERSKYDFEFRAAANGVVAMQMLLDYARDEINRPLILILDLKMPGMTGLQVLEGVRDNPDLKDLPVIVLTTSDEEYELKACLKLGVEHYLIKPVEFDDLEYYIGNMLALK